MANSSSSNSPIPARWLSPAHSTTVVKHHKQLHKMADTMWPMSDSLQRIPDNISVSFLPKASELSQKSLQKGLNYYQQGYIHQIRTAEEGTPVKVSAKCWPSMKKSQPPHKLMLDIDTDRNVISDAYCSCKAGLGGMCSHIVGLLKTLQGLKLYNFSQVPSEQSCTSMPQQWNKPRGEKIKPVRLSEVVVAKATEQRKRKPILCQTDMNYRLPKLAATDFAVLSNLAGTPLEHRISADRPLVSTPFGDVQIGSALSYQITKCDEASRTLRTMTKNQICGDVCVTRVPHLTLPTEYRVLNTHTYCNDPESLEIQTRTQYSDLWFAERGKRLTASNFGKVLSRKKTPNDTFLRTIFGRQNIKAAPLEFGKTHEKVAKEKYLKKFPERHFHECGLVISNEFSFLGATPDGKLCDSGETGIVEVKCPYASRNLTIEEACKEKNFFLEKVDNKISIKKTHCHYAQIQGQLLITGCGFCEFIVYTYSDIHVERVKPDLRFMENMLIKLSHFYKNYALPYLTKDKENHSPGAN